MTLTRYRAWNWVDREWSRRQAIYSAGFDERDDAHWRWGSFVRRLRKKRGIARCGAIQTPDGQVQGAIIYRRDGASFLEHGSSCLYVEYLAAAPWNRGDCTPSRRYHGVGEALLTLAILQSYDWGYEGRVTLSSLRGALNFYKKYDFVETGPGDGRTICCELTPARAVDHLEERGLI